MPDVTLTAAIQEAYASAPVTEVVYHTLEIWHAAFTAAIRVVRDYDDLTATLESTAPRNPSTSVTFTALAFDVKPPEVNQDSSPTLTVEIDNVGREVLAQVELAMSSTTPIEIIYRQYLASALTAPQNNPPLTMQILSISATPFKITAQCGFSDLGNRRFPNLAYTAATFPGLVS
jgi:hypothetical protein